MRWAIAGRSNTKLQAIVARGLTPNGVIVADVENPASLRAMCSVSRLVVRYDSEHFIDTPRGVKG